MSFDPQLFPLGTNMRLMFVVCFQCFSSYKMDISSIPRVPRIKFLVSICYALLYG